MSENMEVMASEMEAPKKVAFANRKYSNEERIKREEEELAQMMAEREQPKQEAEEEQEPAGAEERSFKNRYGDLRRHQQQKEREYEERIQKLEQQLKQASQKSIQLPKSDEDIEAWTKQYPDVAAIVETIAIKKAREQANSLEERVKEIDEMKANAAREKAEAELMRLHPDFDDIRDSEDFHEWVEDQPKWVQDALYENQDDPQSVIRVIDLYKVDKGMDTRGKRQSTKDAASAVRTKRTSKPDNDNPAGHLRESTVQRMSAEEYESRSDEIMESIRSGKFIYDVSGGAR